MTESTVRTLLSQLARAEKIAFLHQAVPPIERLGLAAFHTGSEALHGVAWLGTATVFPQSVGLAATWDTDLIRRVGAAVGTELRAKHDQDPTVSLNAWAPVVNPLRHPLWGRNEEGYSEDPHLTAELATAYAQGLRGDHPDVWLTVPTLKHFLGYNNEQDRDVSSSQLRLRVLYEFELPAYQGPIEAGVIGAVMPSYNLVNGRPAHVSQELLELLRSWTQEPLLVVSDAFAPTNLAGSQSYLPDHVTSHAAALRAGVDSFTDNGTDAQPTIDRLTEALDRGLIGQDDVDQAVHRLLTLRARTGEFAPADDPYAMISASAIDTTEHRELAREAVAKSVVLLRNESILPIGGSTRVAVVGPFAHRVLHDWYSGTPPYQVGMTEALNEALDHEVLVADGADVMTWRSTSQDGYLRVDPGTGRVTVGPQVVTPDCHFAVTDWGGGTLTLTSPAGLLLTSPDGRSLEATATRIGGWEVQESFRLHRHDDATWSVLHLGTGKWLRLQPAGVLELGARDIAGAERFVLAMQDAGLPAVRTAAADADVVIITAGNDPHLLGRETQDRPGLALPQSQAEIIRAARAANPRSVLMIISSYPYVLDAVARQSPAILWSSHGGQELGHGVVDVLTGDQEPYGRLAQSWVASEKDLPAIMDYDIIANRSTYWYAAAAPLFPFGHGLTYSEVIFSDLHCPSRASDPEMITVTVTITNTGSRPVTELVQLYTDAVDHRLPFPRRLAGHVRTEVAPGKSAEATITFSTDQLAVFDVGSGRLTVESGRYAVQVGRSSGDVRCTAVIDIVGVTVPARDICSTAVAAISFDDCERLELVPRDVLVGEVVRARHPSASSGNAALADGNLVLHDVDLASVNLITLVVRSQHGGTVIISERGESGWQPRGRAELAAAEDWQHCSVAAEFVAPIADLRITLGAGTELDTIHGLRPSTGSGSVWPDPEGGTQAA